MQVKFINQSKICLFVSLACFILCTRYNLLSYQNCNFCIYFLDVTYYYINQIIYIFRCGARILVEGDIKQNFIHDSSFSSPVLQWSRQNSVREGETFSKNVFVEDLRKILKNL